MVLSVMAQTSFTKSLRRSQSMNLTAPARPGSTHVGTVRTSSSWTAFTEEHQHGTTPKSGRPLTYKLTNGYSFRSAPPTNNTQLHQGAKPNTSATKRDSIQRLTNGGICYATTGFENKRLSWDTASSDSFPGNRSEDVVEPKSILKSGSRRYSASYGEIAKCASLSRSSLSSLEVSSPNSQTRTSNAPNSQIPRTSNKLLLFDAEKHRNDPADVSGDEAGLKKCNYRLGLSLTSCSDPKKVTFHDDVFVISV